MKKTPYDHIAVRKPSMENNSIQKPIKRSALRSRLGLIYYSVLRPGEVFSYWKLIGKPARRKGYLDGMVLKSGAFHAGCGGGLCQLSNLIFWMTIHTPLTVTERQAIFLRNS